MPNQPLIAQQSAYVTLTITASIIESKNKIKTTTAEWNDYEREWARVDCHGGGEACSREDSPTNSAYIATYRAIVSRMCLCIYNSR